MSCCNSYSNRPSNSWINEYCQNALAQFDCIGLDYDSMSNCCCCPCCPYPPVPPPCPPSPCPPCPPCPPYPPYPPTPTPTPTRSNFLNSVNAAAQAVATTGTLTFPTDRAMNGTFIRHTPGSGQFSLMGPGVYFVSVNAVAAQTAGTVTPLSLAIATDSNVIPGTTVTQNPTALNTSHTLATSTIVTVPANNMTSLSVVNTGTVETSFTNANITIMKIG